MSEIRARSDTLAGTQNMFIVRDSVEKCTPLGTFTCTHTLTHCSGSVCATGGDLRAPARVQTSRAKMALHRVLAAQPGFIPCAKLEKDLRRDAHPSGREHTHTHKLLADLWPPPWRTEHDGKPLNARVRERERERESAFC